MSKELHLCVVMSDSYFPIYQKIFNRTLPKEFDSVNILQIRDHNSLPGLVGERNFKAINYKKLEFVSKLMFTHEGDNLLVLDVDIVCFSELKNEINSLLENYDMVFQRMPDNHKVMPYGIGARGLQCSKKNMNFLAKEVLPRAEALKLSKEMWAQLHSTGRPVPEKWFHYLNGKQEYYDGDQCVINAALLESELGKDINVQLLPSTYATDNVAPKDSTRYKLYHATTSGQTVEEKATTLVNVYENIKRKIE